MTPSNFRCQYFFGQKLKTYQYSRNPLNSYIFNSISELEYKPKDVNHTCDGHGRIGGSCVCFEFQGLPKLQPAHKLISMEGQSANFNGPLLCDALHLLDPKVGKSYAI